MVPVIIYGRYLILPQLKAGGGKIPSLSHLDPISTPSQSHLDPIFIQVDLYAVFVWRHIHLRVAWEKMLPLKKSTLRVFCEHIEWERSNQEPRVQKMLWLALHLHVFAVGSTQTHRSCIVIPTYRNTVAKKSVNCCLRTCMWTSLWTWRRTQVCK